MDDIQPTLGGTWAITVIMVVIASWIIYKYLAPKSFKEWRNAGLIQAFIIALYAEMYGFPLTVYIFVSFLGLDIPWLHMSGHLWSYLFGWGPGMAMVEMFIGYAFVFAGISLIAGGWRQIYRVRKEERLVTDGTYEYIRHPQYTGIYMAIFGQLIHWPTIPTLILSPVIVWAYYRLARKEEKALLGRFGDGYRIYMERVPMFFPRWGNWGRIFGSSERENHIL
jgi:protein-S-isoprenylcysteine O-methyltransferase Ste14